MIKMIKQLPITFKIKMETIYSKNLNYKRNRTSNINTKKTTIPKNALNVNNQIQF